MNAISSVGQNNIAREIGISETTVSNFCALPIKEGGEHKHLLDRACRILAAAGLKCVPVTYECYPRQDIEAIFTLAQRSLRGMSSVDQLRWDE
ncbi:hypothetical protein ACQUFY_21605 [Robbsia andropogonis]|uniref:hypothetical protein n=1 Tax=Robbsia andropogonis TaxID=28092 RepID=UPI003D1AF9A8